MAIKIISKDRGSQAAKIIKQSDYAHLIGLKSNFEKMEQVRTGISKSVLVEIKNHINIDYDSLSIILGTTKTTIHNKKNDEKFSPSVSEKIVALSDLYEFGYRVFENKLNFEKWIQTSNRALGNKKPMELLDTIFGIDEVKNIIGRIEHGVYS
ncbi:MAG: type II RES/Xre toxin-antitoxin system antitoxin [Daejeonella sp.]